MKLLLPLVFLLHSCSLFAGGPLVTSRDLPGWIIGDPDFYNAKQLYGYINGGAELYLEYGFRTVTAQRCTKAENELQVDVYEMVSVDAAFGMFSILRGTCAGTLPGARWSCVRPEQVLFAHDRYLVSVVAYDRSRETRDAVTHVAKALLKRAGKKEYQPNELFRSGPLSPGLQSLRFLRGPLALQSALPEWSDRFKGIERFEMEYSRFGDGAAETEAAIIRFRSRRDAERFLLQSNMPAAMKAKGWFVAKDGASAMVKDGKTVYYLAGGRAEKLRPRIK
ncbi:MAG: DUF6599 family protein [Bacteroidota bacterium]|nr:DUF6599 family protein [Bacteroidota bacterium]